MSLRSALGLSIGAAAMLYMTWTAAITARNLRRFGAQDAYAVGYALDRFGSLAGALPPGTAVGYLTDIPAEVPERATFFSTTRYAVAPLLLQDLTGLPLVVGDFKRPEDVQAIVARQGLSVERDLGNGAYLLRRGQR